MKKPDYIPHDYKGIKVVSSLTELFNEPFGEANCILFPRTLTGDFNNLARCIKKLGLSHFLQDGDHMPFVVRHAERQIKADMKDIQKALADKQILRRLQLRVDMRTYWNPDVSPCAFHIDASVSRAFGRVLCNYNAPSTEWIRNEDAIPVENLNYDVKPNAPIYNFKPGDIWRQKSDMRDSSSFIHRVPKSVEDRTSKDAPRLLLVAG